MDPMSIYMHEARIPLLTANDELELGKKIAEGCINSRNKLVEHNLRLVIYIASKYINTGIPIADLIAEGNIGLMKAADKFDYTKGFRFSTYAIWWIRQYISRCIVKEVHIVQLPVNKAELLRKLAGLEAQLTTSLRRTPTNDELAGAMGMTPARLQALQKHIPSFLFLDAEVIENNDKPMNNYDNHELLQQAPNYDTIHYAHQLLASTLLSDKEKQILKSRYIEGQTLHEVGKTLGLTRERVRQIEAKALFKLRRIYGKV